MMFKIHTDSIIGIKKLTTSDLGFKNNGMTHIGLFKNTFNFLNITESQSILSTLIYQDNTFDLVSILDPITRADGRQEAPKIRKGEGEELFFEDTQMNSVTRQVREIAETDRTINRYLLWFGLETKEIVYLLFDEDSFDFKLISNIVGAINDRKIKIINFQNEFKPLVEFLASKDLTVNSDYYEELEIASQTGIKKTKKRKIPRPQDIERANKIFKAIGEEGEKLLFQYLESEKRQSKIKDFKWINQSREMYYEYDFEIIANDNSIVFSDAKSTNRNFEDHRPIYLSTNELNFIDKNKNNYLIHRLFSVGEEPKIKICDNIHTVSDIFIPKYNAFNRFLNAERLSIQGVKLAIPTNLDMLNFDNEILLNVNA